jgi:hypothetical protein
MITIKHSSNLQLGYKKMREWVFRELDRKCRSRGLPVPTGLYLNADYLAELSASLDSKDKIERYIEKNRKPLDVNGKNVWFTGKQGAKRSQEFVAYKPELAEEDSLDSRLAQTQDQENEGLLAEYDSDQDSFDLDDYTDDPVEYEPASIPLKPLNHVPHVKLSLPKFSK